MGREWRETRRAGKAPPSAGRTILRFQRPGNAPGGFSFLDIGPSLLGFLPLVLPARLPCRPVRAAPEGVFPFPVPAIRFCPDARDRLTSARGLRSSAAHNPSGGPCSA